ncbi:MAG: hypothetical protein LBK53_05995 [Heliobacteriaceae bacterium]|jgi:hypothetical protein|nr:hypothetical protein [Heliobacteriaceae bacterium]
MSKEKVLFSLDFLRLSETSYKTRLLTFWNILEYQLKLAIGNNVERFNPYNSGFNVGEFYKLAGVQQNEPLSWVGLYALKDVPGAAVQYFAKYLKAPLVIYYGAPKIVKAIHNKLNIPYISFEPHPVRFLDDIFFYFQTNNEKIFNRIKKYQVDERLFYIQAGLHKAMFAPQHVDVKPNSILFAGQTNGDSSLYKDGKLLSIFDFEHRIKEFGEKYEKIYYKAHPYNKDLGKTISFLKQYPFVEFINESVYKLMSKENIAKVCAITSGVCYEAKYFGKNVEFLSTPHLNFNYSKDCIFDETISLSVLNEFFDPHFWSDILQDIIPTVPSPGFLIPHRANRIRAAIGGWWSIVEIDPTICLTDLKYGNLENEILTLKRSRPYFKIKSKLQKLFRGKKYD